jgi:hypothetical protein
MNACKNPRKPTIPHCIVNRIICPCQDSDGVGRNVRGNSYWRVECGCIYVSSYLGVSGKRGRNDNEEEKEQYIPLQNPSCCTRERRMCRDIILVRRCIHQRCPRRIIDCVPRREVRSVVLEGSYWMPGIILEVICINQLRYSFLDLKFQRRYGRH